MRQTCSILATLIVAGMPITCRPERPVTKPEAPAPVVRAGGSERDLVVARLGERQITLGEIEDRLKAMPVFVRLRYQSPERKRDFLEAYVQYQALALAAERDGYAADPAVIDAMKSDLVERYLWEHVESKVRNSDISEDAVAAYYRTHPLDFHRPAQVRISHLLKRDRAAAARLAERMRGLMIDEPGDPVGEFAKLVTKHSEDSATRNSGGDLGLFPRVERDDRTVPGQVDQAAVRMTRIFEVSDPVEAEDGFHVLFVTATRPEVDQSLDQARPAIVTWLMDVERDRKRKEFIDSALREASVTIDEAVFERAVATAKESK